MTEVVVVILMFGCLLFRVSVPFVFFLRRVPSSSFTPFPCFTAGIAFIPSDERLGEARDAGQGPLAPQRPPHGGVAKPARALRGLLRGLARYEVVQRPLHPQLPGHEVSGVVQLPMLNPFSSSI